MVSTLGMVTVETVTAPLAGASTSIYKGDAEGDLGWYPRRYNNGGIHVVRYGDHLVVDAVDWNNTVHFGVINDWLWHDVCDYIIIEDGGGGSTGPAIGMFPAEIGTAPFDQNREDYCDNNTTANKFTRLIHFQSVSTGQWYWQNNGANGIVAEGVNWVSRSGSGPIYTYYNVSAYYDKYGGARQQVDQ